jgi:hypothetical protein
MIHDSLRSKVLNIFLLDLLSSDELLLKYDHMILR